MPDTDIDSLDYGAARDYVLAYLAALKQSQKQRAIAEEELAQWVHRVKLAENRGEPLLKRSAEERAGEARGRVERMRAEERELGRKAAVLKEKLQALRVRAGLGVDAEALLAQLQMLAGEPDRLEAELKEEEAQAALQKLKKKHGS
jgi:hypothetical protein